MILRSISLGCFALALIASSRAEEFVDLIDPMFGAITESGGHGGHGLGKTIPGEEGSDLIATVNCHSRFCLWYNFRHEKISRQPSQPVLSSDQSDSPSVTDEEIAAAVKTVGDGYKGANLVLSDLVRAVPLLREAYRAAEDEKAKLCYAYTLGILGDATGVETLVAQALKPTGERLVINTEGKTSFGRRMTEFPSQLVALGRTKSPKAIPAIKAEIGRMKTSWSGELARAIDLACEALPSPEFADDLAEVLRRPGIGRHGDRPE